MHIGTKKKKIQFLSTDNIALMKRDSYDGSYCKTNKYQ